MSSESVTRNDLLLCVKTGEYPIQLADMPGRHPNISMGPKVQRTFLESMGYALVKRTVRPINDVVVEEKPAIVDGVLTQIWSDRKFTEQEIAQRLRDKKDKAQSELYLAIGRTLETGVAITYNGQAARFSLVDTPWQSVRGLQHSAQSAKQSLTDEQLSKWSYPVYTTEDKLLRLSYNQLSELVSVCYEAIDAIKQMAAKLHDDIEASELEEHVPTSTASLTLELNEFELSFENN